MGIIFSTTILFAFFLRNVIGKVISIGVLEFDTINVLIQTKKVFENIAINNIEQVILYVATGASKFPETATTYVTCIKLKNNQAINLHIKRINITNTTFFNFNSQDIFSKLNDKRIPWKFGYVDEANCINM